MVQRINPKETELSCRSGDIDVSVIQRLKEGDEKALELIIDKYQQDLWGYAVYMVGGADQAEDIVQDVFIQLWNKRDRIQIDFSLKNYLYRIVRNTTLNALSSAKARRVREIAMQVEREDKVVQSGNDLEEDRFDEALRIAIGQLPDRCAEIFILVRHHHMSYAEVAELLEISVSTVKTQMGRAMSSLATKLAPFLGVIAILAKI